MRMSLSGSMGSPSKDSLSAVSGSFMGSDNLPRDFSRLSLFSAGSSTSQDEQFRCEGHAEHSLSCMQNYLLAGKLCDVTLISGTNGKKVQAHRLVLSAASEYFSAMFTGNMRESEESEITIRDVSGDVLQAVVNYCYTGSVEIREDNVETLLATACLMQLHEVVEACSRFLAHQLHPSNCLGIAVFAEHQSCTSLLQQAKAYTSQHFMQVLDSIKLVLSAASEYFSAMFTGNMRESEESEITIRDVSGDVLQAVVNYCYTGSVEIREDNVETLLATACLMQLHEVVEACSRFLAHQLHPSNCLGIAVFAEHQSCTSLLQQAKAYTSQHFMQVIHNQEFLQLSAEQMANLLSNEELNVSSEEHIFHALMSWIQTEPFSRKPHMARLLTLVKLPLLTPSFLMDQVEPAVSDDHECLKLITEAMKWHLLPERRLQMANVRTRPRKSTLGRLLVVGGMDKNKGATTIESYDPRSDTWTVVYHMSGRRLQFGIALMSDKLLVVGGRDGLKTLNTMECLDMKTDNWTQLAPMNTHRHGLGVAVLNGPIYAVGGHDGWSYLNTVERYDPAARSWSYVAPMQSQRCSAGVAVLNGKLYAVGGRDGASCLKTVECYDPHTNKWTTCTALSRRRGGVGVAVANGFLYAMGGQDAPANNPAASRFDCVERYDPSTDTWTVIASLSNKRDAVAACLFGDRLIAIGGYDGSHYLRTVEQYCPIVNEWTTLAPLITGRAGACVIALPQNVTQPND